MIKPLRQRHRIITIGLLILIPAILIISIIGRKTIPEIPRPTFLNTIDQSIQETKK